MHTKELYIGSHFGIGSITFTRKDADQKYLGTLTKFHYRQTENNNIEQLKSNKSTDGKLVKNRALPQIHEPNVKEHAERIESIQKKMTKLNK